MAIDNGAEKKPAETGNASSDVEQKVVALAEQIGWFLGTVQAKADGWLERETLARNVSRIRDRASEVSRTRGRFRSCRSHFRNSP